MLLVIELYGAELVIDSCTYRVMFSGKYKRLRLLFDSLGNALIHLNTHWQPGFICRLIPSGDLQCIPL